MRSTSSPGCGIIVVRNEHFAPTRSGANSRACAKIAKATSMELLSDRTLDRPLTLTAQVRAYLLGECRGAFPEKHRQIVVAGGRRHLVEEVGDKPR